MIIYITSYENSQDIVEAIKESGVAILESVVDSKVSIAKFVKEKMDVFQSAKIILVDLDALKDEEKEIIETFQSIRILYEKKKIIVITNKMSAGSHLLSELFCLGIYNIVCENLKEEILYCIQNGKEYKHGISFKCEDDREKEFTSTIKEKVIIKKQVERQIETVQNVNKALVGFVGTYPRSGVTHNVIVSANLLRKNGFKVAVVEYQSNENKVFSDIKEEFMIETNDRNDYFTIEQVDYFADFNLQNISKVFQENYNFILIDFGLFQEEKLSDLSRCMMQIIVCGSKAWETKHLNRIFKTENEEDNIEWLNSFYYLFNFTDQTQIEGLKEDMNPLSKIYITDYLPDPFHPNQCEYSLQPFSEYLISKKEVKNSSIHIPDIRTFFQKRVRKGGK